MTTPQPSSPPPIPPPAPSSYGSVATGMGAPTGSGSSASARLLSAVGGLILSPLLVVLGAGMAGAAFYRLQTLDLRMSAGIPIILFGLGAVLVAFLLALIIRVSSVGAYVGATVLLVIGLSALLAPRLAFQITTIMGRAFRGPDVFVISGMPLVLSGLLAGAGVAASMIRRR